MPYKLDGDTVMVQRGKKWVVLKKHKNHKEALAHLKALYANVPEAKTK